MISEAQVYRSIGARIRDARKSNKTTQLDLAKGVQLERSSIANIEAGNQRVPVHVLYRIAQKLGRDVNQFLPAPAELMSTQEADVAYDLEGQIRHVPPSVADVLAKI